MNKAKTLGLVLALFTLLAAPKGLQAPNVNEQVHRPDYLKVMAFKGNFEDTFYIYVFGEAERVKVKNEKRFDIEYNKTIYLQLNDQNEIVNVK